jgi:hypothetical protein
MSIWLKTNYISNKKNAHYEISTIRQTLVNDNNLLRLCKRKNPLSSGFFILTTFVKFINECLFKTVHASINSNFIFLM